MARGIPHATRGPHLPDPKVGMAAPVECHASLSATERGGGDLDGRCGFIMWAISAHGRAQHLRDWAQAIGWTEIKDEIARDSTCE